MPTICFCASALVAFVAIFGFSRDLSTTMPWILVMVAAGLAVMGGQFFSQIRENRDMLAQRHAENELLTAQLHEQERAIDSLADGLDVAVFICDSRAAILYANHRARELFRFENPVGRSILAVTLSYELEQLVIKADSEKVAQRQEIAFTYPDERVGLSKAWPSQGGRCFLSVYEVTDLKRLERVRQDFVANVSHELRTPMTVIRAYAETLLDEDPPTVETSLKYLPRIITEVDRLSSITQDLLILSAAESNPVRKQTCDIADVVRLVVSQLQFKAEEKGLALTYHGPDHFSIEANSAQMTQVALNLVDNAINYTANGHVDAELTTEDAWVCLIVRDTGFGIPSDQVGRIFERFYRVDKGRSRATGGTGLGLSIVKHIVEAHGGTVEVESEMNVGTTFKVRLPFGNV